MLPDIFLIQTDDDFEKAALATFVHQFENNPVYRSFCDLLFKHPSEVNAIVQIPFLPIQFFKSHKVVSLKADTFHEFTSTGTTGNASSHFVSDLLLYEKSYLNGFNFFYENIEEVALLALLPSYLERSGSSLIYMINDLIKKSGHPKSGFFLNDMNALAETLIDLDQSGQKTILIGVSFALLDLVEKTNFNLKHTIVMETGGMKGRRKEVTREELHLQLKKGFGVSKIHSEYGMTELLSQAYSLGNGIFKCPPWMRVSARKTDDPLTIQDPLKIGGLNVIDLANYNSCSFIATQDLGKVYEDGSFEVLGRFDHADIRGCNLMML